MTRALCLKNRIITSIFIIKSCAMILILAALSMDYVDVCDVIFGITQPG